MALTTMYAGKINSPATIITGAYTIGDNHIHVSELDYFPTSPNLAVIGTGVNAVTFLYTAKSAASGAGDLTGVSVLQGTDKNWPVDSPIYRGFTAYDYDTLRENITTVYTSANASIMLMPGGAFIPTVAPAGWEQGETAVQGNCYQYGSFTHTSTCRMQWNNALPSGWNNGNLTARVYWTSTSATQNGDVKWDLLAYSFGDTNPLDTALPAIISVTDTLSTNDVMQVSAETGTFTITGTGKFNIIELQRDYDDVTDTLDDAAQILAIEVKYVRTQTY
jgi:hypothetical protein